MFENEETSAGSNDESEENSASEGNKSEADEEDDEADSGAIPNLNIKGPGKVNVRNSKGVKIGNTINMTLKVDKMIVQNEANQQHNTAAIAGFVVNRLTEVMQGNAANQLFLSEISAPMLQDVPSSSNSLRKCSDGSGTRIRLEDSGAGECYGPVENLFESVSTPLLGADHQSTEVMVDKQESCSAEHDNWWKMLLNDKTLQCEIEQNSLLELLINSKENTDEDNNIESDVSVNSLIDEFVQNVNNSIILAHEENIHTPEFNIELDFDFFKRKMCSGQGKLTGYQPLVRDDKKIEIELVDKLIFLKIPLYLKNLKVVFKDFSLGLSNFSFSGVTIEVGRTDISLIITAAPNDNGFLDTDITNEVSFEEIKTEFTGNVAQQALLLLAKNQVKRTIRDGYMDHINSILKQMCTDVITDSLLYDFCCKLISLYDVG